MFATFRQPFLPIIYITVGFLIFPSFGFGELLEFSPHQNLARLEGTGVLSLQYGFKNSDEFFAANGALLSSSNVNFPAGVPESYIDQRCNLHGDYGLTERLVLAFDIPLLYRQEDQSLQADDFGLGDVRFSMIYRLLQTSNQRFQLAGFSEVKFPSGDSDIQLLNVSGAVDRELPLGSGQYDLTGGIQLLQQWERFALRAELAFRYRFSDLVQYGQAFQQGTDPFTGQLFSQAVGNVEVQYGHEFIYTLVFTQYNLLPEIDISAKAHLRHFLDGEVQNFAINLTSITQNRAVLPAGYYLSLTPEVLWHVNDRWKLKLSAEVPVAGEDVPIIPIVESLVGIPYMMTVAYVY